MISSEMGAKKKARKAAISHHQQSLPSVTTDSTLYTSSYMIVQEPSPPLSSSQLSFSSSSSSEQSREFPDATIPSRPLRHKPEARCVKRNTPKTPQGSVRQSDKTVVGSLLSPHHTITHFSIQLHDNNELGRQETTSSPMEPGIGPRMPLTQQTTKLVDVLVRNKSILPKRVEPNKHADDSNCNMAVRSVSRVVEDWHFQSWRQVTAWIKRQCHRQQRTIKALALPSTRRSSRISTPRKRRKNGAVPFGTAFKKSLVPIISTLVMSINAQKFLRLVVEAIGARRLTRVFHHHLIQDYELPDDIIPLIFSPLFLKTFKRQIQKINSATRNRDKPENTEGEWSDWEEEDHDGEASDKTIVTRPIDSDALPSIEQESASEDVPELATGENPEAPSTLVASREPGTRMTWTKMKCKARWKKAAGCEDDANGSSQFRPTLPSPIEDPTRRPVPYKIQVQAQLEISGRDQVAEKEQAGGRESGTLFSSAPHVHPLADFTAPLARSPPDHEAESILHFRNLLRDINEQKNAKIPKKVNPNEAVNETRQHVTNSSPREEDKATTKKNAATEHPGKALSTFNNQGATPSASQTRDGPASICNPVLPARETPAILRAENQRQEHKLTKPLAPTKIPSRSARRKQNGSLASRRGAQAEISPLDFYNSSTCNNTRVLQPKNYSERSTWNNRKASNKEENRPGGNNNNSVVVRNSPPKHHDGLRSRQNSPSDDELSLPSLEEIYESLLTAQEHRSTETTQQPATTTTTMTMTTPTTTQTELEPRLMLGQLTRRGNNSKKKRRRDEYTEETTIPSAAACASPPKRTKSGAGESSRHNNRGTLHQPRARVQALSPLPRTGTKPSRTSLKADTK
ncbi:hypothetical protein F4680DRAFT_202339 [Xylaria scruposa]|nr:hypothetical protein F4680DRAFT_202339 [Xylaria scruposa]